MKRFAEKSSEKIKMSIAWSLKPVLFFMKISGIPTYYEPKIKHCILRILGYFCHYFPSLICLFLNCFFQINRFVEDCYRHFSLNIINNNIVPPVLQECIETLQIAFEPLLVTGVPFVFACQFYFTKKFKTIWSSIQIFDERLQLPDDFYRKCRKHSWFLIAIAIMVKRFNCWDDSTIAITIF